MTAATLLFDEWFAQTPGKYQEAGQQRGKIRRWALATQPQIKGRRAPRDDVKKLLHQALLSLIAKSTNRAWNLRWASYRLGTDGSKP